MSDPTKLTDEERLMVLRVHRKARKLSPGFMFTVVEADSVFAAVEAVLRHRAASPSGETPSEPLTPQQLLNDAEIFERMAENTAFSEYVRLALRRQAERLRASTRPAPTSEPPHINCSKACCAPNRLADA